MVMVIGITMVTSTIVHCWLQVQVHGGVGLGLHVRDPRDVPHGAQEGLLGVELRVRPGAELLRRQGHDNFEVIAPTAYDALHAGDAGGGLDVSLDIVQHLLGGSQGGLVVVGRPFESPFSGDSVEFNYKDENND